MIKYLYVLLASISLFGAAEAQSLIQAGRAIEIRIQGVPSEEMSRINSTYPISEAGNIRMPFIGNVRAAGMSPNALASRIENAYKTAKIYTNPTIQVIASSDESIATLTLVVGGYVRSPGPQGYTRGMTLYQALQAAGGANEFGAKNRVRLIRDGKIRQYDMNETSSKLVEVKPNDTIEVPQKNIFGR